MQQLEKELRQFIGTIHYYKHFTGLLFTDGVKHLAERAGAFWLIDLIASWQGKQRVKSCPFQIWELKVNGDRTATVTMKEDDGEPYKVKQKIEYTDFPLSEIKLYCIDGVLLLPSEY